MRHAGTQDIETPRLLLRRLLPEDAPQFVKDYHSYYKTRRGYHPRPSSYCTRQEFDVPTKADAK